jgi:hypothetical protein
MLIFHSVEYIRSLVFITLFSPTAGLSEKPCQTGHYISISYKSVNYNFLGTFFWGIMHQYSGDPSTVGQTPESKTGPQAIKPCPEMKRRGMPVDFAGYSEE